MPASPRRSPGCAAGRRISRSSWPPPGSGSRTRGSRRGSCGGRGRLPGEDFAQRLDVDVLEHAAALGLLEPRHHLGAENVDLAVEDAAAVRDLLLLTGVLVDQALQILVGQRCEI